jgi:hypothetical protein
MEEEGHYITIGRVFKAIYDNLDFRGDGASSVLQVMQDEWTGLKDFEKKNLRRIFVDLAGLALMTLLTRLVLGFADDEENEDNELLQYLAYITVRTNSELASTQLLGAKGLVDILEDPMVAARTVKTIVDVSPSEYFDEVEHGRYEGYTELERMLLKITWGKHFHSLGDIRTTNNMYRMMNANTLLFVPTAKQNRGE